MPYLFLNENDVERLITPELAIEAMRECFEEKAQGTFNALAKINIEGINGPLRITPGESQVSSNCIGFRVYDVIRKDFSNQEQVIVVYDNTSGALKGVIVSELLGAYRTAAINAVIHNSFKKKIIKVLGIVGIGFQARIHLQLFCALLNPKQIVFYARNEEKAKHFKSEMEAILNRELVFKKNVDEIYEISDSLLLATNSRIPILDEHPIKSGITITTIGPKLRQASEVSSHFANSCDLIVSDSIEQVQSYGEKFFINTNRVQDYADRIKAKKAFRENEEHNILICSVGMGGTEVVLGSKLLDKRLKANND